MPYATTIGSTGTWATVSNTDTQVGDSRVRVLWFSSTGKGKIHAQVRFNFGLLVGYQYNSDQIDVNVGLGIMGNISGATSLSCASGYANYSIAPVSGATSYTWTATNGVVLSSQNGTSATFALGSWVGSSQIRVTAHNSSCNQTKTSLLNVNRTNASSIIISGNTNIGAGSTYNSYLAFNGYQEVAATNFVWNITSNDLGWAISDGQGTNNILVTAPNIRNSQAQLSFSATNACGNPIFGIKDIVTGNEIQLERVTPEIKNLLLFPNPSADQVTVSGIGKDTGTLVLYDKLGQELRRFENITEGFTFSVAGLVADTYTVHFITKETVKSFRLLVNHN